jgi:hypothetical protein
MRGPAIRLRSTVPSGIFSGSVKSQSMQRNLRPPVLTSIKRICLRHFGHAGGAGFLGIGCSPGSGGSTTLSVTDNCRGRPVMTNSTPAIGIKTGAANAAVVVLPAYAPAAFLGRGARQSGGGWLGFGPALLTCEPSFEKLPGALSTGPE